MPRDDAPAPPGVAAPRLEWTRELAERFWRAAYSRDLSPARFPRRVARHIAAILARRMPAGDIALTLGDRDSEYAAALLLAGFRVGRIDTGPLLRGTIARLAEHRAWLGSFAGCGGDADLVLVPDALAQLMADELAPLFAAARAALRPGGRLAVTVPNGEVLDQALSLCPASGVLFHKDQRVREFSSGGLRSLLEGEGFLVNAVLEAQPDEAGFRAPDANGWRASATEPRLHFGDGSTLLVIAVQPGHPREGDADAASRWLASRRAVAEATPTPELAEWEWTPANIGEFWTRLASTPLNSLSFGLIAGSALLAALEPWLVPGGRHLDIGAGEGEMARILAEAGYAVAALEPSAGRRQMLAEKMRGAAGYIGGFGAIDGDLAGSFDMAMAFEVVEHVPAPDLPAFFATFTRALAPGGRLLISTPNREDLDDSVMVSPQKGVLYHRWQHVHAFDRETLAALLAEHGFAVEVMHEIDTAVLLSGASPYAPLALAGGEGARLGDGATLVAIAHRVGERPAPPRNPLSMTPRIVPPMDQGTVAATVGERPAPPCNPLSTPPQIMPPIDQETVAATVGALPSGSRVRRGLLPIIKRAMPVVHALRPIARRVLPPPVKRFLVRLVLAAETQAPAELAATFAGRRVLLKDLPPLLDAESFDAGPIILVNNALAWGGAERQVVTTLKGLAARVDRQVGLLCLRLGEGAEYDFFLPAMQDFPGFVRNTVKTGEARRILASMPPAATARVRAAIDWLPADVQEQIESLAADFLQLRPAVVHAWQDGGSIVAAYAACIVGVPKIVVSGRNLSAPNFAYCRPYMEYAYREIGSVADIAMINNSAAGAADYVAWVGLPINRIQVLRNGIDPAAFTPPTAEVRDRLRAQLGIPEGAPVVGSIFRFDDEKQPLRWIETASLVATVRPDCHFVIVGTGPLRAQALDLARRSGLAERLHSPGTSAAAAAHLALFDVFLLTSRVEGTPNVVLEASLSGVPVVATDAGGTAEAIEEGVTGLVVRDDDAAAIAAHVLQVLDDATWRERVRAAGPHFVQQRFGLERMLQETLALYGL